MPVPNYEEICDYNGQRVWINGRTHEPMHPHDCGNADCDLLSSPLRRDVNEPVRLDEDDWGLVSEYYDEFGDD